MKIRSLLTGRQDISVGYQNIIEIIEEYPRATLAVLDMAGHNLQIEHLDYLRV